MSSSENKLIDGVKTFESLKHAVVRREEEINSGSSGKKAVLLFGAEWHEACIQLKMVLQVLAKEKTGIMFFYIDAEDASELSSPSSGQNGGGFNITSVPTLILLNGLTLNSSSEDDSGQQQKLVSYNILERLEGGVLEPAQVTLAVQRLVVAPEGSSTIGSTSNGDMTAGASSNQQQQQPAEPNTTPSSLNDRLVRLVRGDTVMLFMKGTPTAPRCGFSRQAVEILASQGVEFGSFNILEDEEVRQGLKTYSDWPTYPQIYVKGELMGGLDILKETAEEGSLKDQWEISDLTDGGGGGGGGGGGEPSLHDRLSKLVNRNPTMLFMKGLPSAPKCGFSRQIVEILDESNVSYDAFNILEDEEVRQGLKEFSDWPTYPQLYHDGELLGGLDIVQELKESGELDEMLSSA